MFNPSKFNKIIFVLVLVIGGIIITYPSLDFQPFLSPGDHGRDLYCFKRTMEGALPYRDYSWPFGPLMPYYYSTFYRLFGVSIQSVLLGQNLLILLSGVFLYLICSTFLSPTLSLISALWYWGFRNVEFFYTYNHNGGILALLVTVYFLFRYIDKPRFFYIYAGSLSLLLLMLIRLNIGIATLVVFFSSLAITDFDTKDPQMRKKGYWYIGLSLFLLAITFFIYWFLLNPLPDYVIHQSLPYAKSDRADTTTTLWDTFFILQGIVIADFTATWPRRFFGIFLFLSLLRCVSLVFRNELSEKFKIKIFLVFNSLVLLIVFNLHEFLLSGVSYRLNWVFPLVIILFFYLIAMGTSKISSSVIKMALCLTLLLAAFFPIVNQNRIIQSWKTPQNLLNMGKNHVYASQNPGWFRTVRTTTAFIMKNVPKDDKILSLPFDPLYNFLTEKDSPTRQLIFFDHINVRPQQEKEVIAQLEKKRVNFIILSSRSDTLEKGMGVFGKTYCPLLAKYIFEHFEVIATFGDWKNPPGWAWNHGTKILRRTNP